MGGNPPVRYCSVQIESSPSRSAARLGLRLSESVKQRIDRAADLRGVPVSAFVRDAVLREADKVVAKELSIALSPEESRRFLEKLDAAFAPNARLRKALGRVAKAR